MGTIATGAAAGAFSGLAGAAAMAAVSKAEQLVTGRPDSYVPGRTRGPLASLMQTIYSLVTGALADALVRPSPSSSARRPALGARLRGFA